MAPNPPSISGKDLARHKLEHEAIDLTGTIESVAKRVSGSPVLGGGGGGATALSGLSDVDLSTPLTDGQTLVFDGAATYTASLSPLRWGGNDYKQPALGASATPSIIVLFTQTPTYIESDGALFTREGTTNIHVGLVHWTDGTRSTIYIGDGIATTKAGMETILQTVDATAAVDNFKANYFVYSAGASYTGGTLTGFDVAGAVTVISGGNATPAITYVSPPNKMKAGTNYVPQHFGAGIFSGQGDTAQAVANNTATVINLDTDTLYRDSNGYITADATSHGFIVGATTITGGWGNITLLDDAGALISTAVIELQKQNQDTSWTTQFAGLGGSLTFPFNYGDGQNNVTFRVRVTQTSGGSKNVFCQCHIYWDI